MNTELAYAFGMLTTLAAAMIAVIVVGLVKAIKQQKRIHSLEQELSRTQTDVFSVIEQLDRRIDRSVENIQRDINSLYSYVDSRYDKIQNRMDKPVEKVRKKYPANVEVTKEFDDVNKIKNK